MNCINHSGEQGTAECLIWQHNRDVAREKGVNVGLYVCVCGKCVVHALSICLEGWQIYKNRIGTPIANNWHTCFDYLINLLHLIHVHTLQQRSGGIRLKGCEDVTCHFSGVCGLWGNISDSTAVKVNGMMGIVAPCIVGFSMRLGVNESGTGLAMMDTYDGTCTGK